MAVAGLIAGAASSVIGGLFQGFGARKAARRAARRAKAMQRKLDRLVANRQEITDPSASTVDRSGLISNQFANLQVSTQAAEFQAEEADLSLASTLDTLRATGAGSGGATALAQAALRSKAGISASIEQQEAQNAKLRAQGAMQAQGMRLQEGGRVDQARMQGEMFRFRAQEARQFRDEDRQAGLLDAARARAAQAREQARAGFGQALGGLVGFAGAGLVGGGSFAENLKANAGGN
jgi:hypothetical protein